MHAVACSIKTAPDTESEIQAMCAGSIRFTAGSFVTSVLFNQEVQFPARCIRSLRTCVFRGKLAIDSGVKLATDSGLKLATDSGGKLATFRNAPEQVANIVSE
jgi:hypothetical protein